MGKVYETLTSEPVDPLRSRMMSRIGRRDTTPEMAVRRALHAAGYRFRLQASELPGRPDIVMRPRRVAIFVHGCFWHRHPGCRLSSTPKTRVDFWTRKFEANVARDEKSIERLREMGWTVLVVWECQTRSSAALDAWIAANVPVR